AMRTTTIGYSSLRSVEMSVRAKLASGHCLDSVLHRRFVDRDRWLADESPVKSSMNLCSANHRRFTSILQITSCSSPKFHR
ncbi:hypothetical protein HAX54_013371, partial [Datura stramonium]|nr:hypothetical protein [Datura stramonium]